MNAIPGANAVRWTLGAEAKLRPALGDDLAIIAADVRDGRAELWYSPRHGYMVTRFETFATGRVELVIVGAVGEGLHEMMPGILYYARKHGAAAVRVHSRRPGMGRALERWGFELAEHVYLRDVDNG